MKDANNVIDIWTYVSNIPKEELDGHVLVEGMVEHVYRTPDDHYDHCLVVTQTENVYLTVVVDLIADSIYGHHLLNLNKE